MRILFITRKYPPAIGGMETFSYGLTQALADQCTVLNLKKPWCKWQHYDVIHIGDGVLAGLGVVLKKLFRKPVVITVHGLDVTYRPGWYQRYIRWALPKLDAVVCVSSATADQVKQRIQSQRLEIIPNGVDVEQWPVNQEIGKNRCLLFVGRLVPRKGCAWFVEHVLPQLTDIHLHIVGTGPELPHIQALVKQLKLDDRVRFHGQVSAGDLRKHYTNAQALIMPNIVIPGDMEGFGFVAVEAGACGLPVIATDLEGIRSAVIDGQTGFLVESGNVAAWVAAVQRILTTPLSAQDIRSRVQQHYSWNQVKRHYQTIYQSITVYGKSHDIR
ncbi:MAG: Glycosyl transferase, group 1 [uncultured bacterium]|nr:MAG: Glycosyl transferase, group 1 [uncultured bacterium]